MIMQKNHVFLICIVVQIFLLSSLSYGKAYKVSRESAKLKLTSKFQTYGKVYGWDQTSMTIDYGKFLGNVPLSSVQNPSKIEVDIPVVALLDTPKQITNIRKKGIQN